MSTDVLFVVWTHTGTHLVFSFLYGFFMHLFMFKMSNVALDTLQTPPPLSQSPADSVFKVLPCCRNRFITKSAKNPIKDLCRIQKELQHVWPGLWFTSACLVTAAQMRNVCSSHSHARMHTNTHKDTHTNTDTYSGSGAILFCLSGWLLCLLHLLSSFYIWCIALLLDFIISFFICLSFHCFIPLSSVGLQKVHEFGWE